MVVNVAALVGGLAQQLFKPALLCGIVAGVVFLHLSQFRSLLDGVVEGTDGVDKLDA